MKHGKMELVIILPKNVDQLASGQEHEASDHSFHGRISEKTIHSREKSVKQELIQHCLSELEKNS
jgi:hypothetical protein